MARVRYCKITVGSEVLFFKNGLLIALQNDSFVSLKIEIYIKPCNRLILIANGSVWIGANVGMDNSYLGIP